MTFLLFLVSSIVSMLFIQSFSSHIHLTNIFNVVEYGAVGDGLTNDTQAFNDAWKAICGSSGSEPTMVVPSEKTFLLRPLIFEGHCNSDNINVVIDGNLIAPSNPSEWNCQEQICKSWIEFNHVNSLNITGFGVIDGQGSNWWGSCNHKSNDCGKKPTGFVIAHSNKVHLSNLNFKDSPQMQIALERSTWVYITNLNITAPSQSPNTDGIHIQESQNVFVTRSTIGTGDDCISIGDGSSYLDITDIVCGPGHGISIGSLGKNGAHETVEHVHVRNVVFEGTSNGARIKTWQGGSGYARNIVFERMTMHDVKHPIIIDQFYCDHQHCTNQPSAVKISNITYNKITGTSSEKTAIDFACSETLPCREILVENVNIQYAGHRSNTSARCQNAIGAQEGYVIPSTIGCLESNTDP